MFLPNHSTKTSYLLLRIGLAIVFVWFGIHQLLVPGQWTAWIPEWFLSLGLVDAITFIRIHAAINVVFGILLGLGKYTRWVAAAVALWLFDIIVVNGFTLETTRDIGLLCAALALVFLPIKRND